MSQPIKASQSNGTLNQTTGASELTDEDLEQVAGGTSVSALGKKAIAQDVTTNRAKTADKAANAVDAYIRS